MTVPKNRGGAFGGNPRTRWNIQLSTLQKTWTLLSLVCHTNIVFSAFKFRNFLAFKNKLAFCANKPEELLPPKLLKWFYLRPRCNAKSETRCYGRSIRQLPDDLASRNREYEGGASDTRVRQRQLVCPVARKKESYNGNSFPVNRIFLNSGDTDTVYG